MVTVGYRSLPNGYSGLQHVTAGNRVVTVGYSSLEQVTEWLQCVTGDDDSVTCCNLL